MENKKENELIVNQIPRKTWYWLNLNDHKITFSGTLEDASPKVSLTGNVRFEWQDMDPDMFGGAGKDFQAFLNAQCMDGSCYTVPERETGTVRLTYDAAGDEVSRPAFYASEGSHLTAVMDLHSGADQLLAVQAQAFVEENAEMTLVQLFRNDDAQAVVGDVSAKVGKNAHLTLIQVILNGRNNVVGARVALEGSHSTLTISNGYTVSGKDVLDINYDIPQFGKSTDSHIEVDGVLRDEAVKNFRGTIDFRTGSSGSTGSERENVLLIDDGVHNRSLPVILCSEEDVEGTHGASIGKLDEDTLFYLESRGLDENQVYEMLALSRVMAVIHQIPDEDTVKALEKELLPSEDEEEGGC